MSLAYADPEPAPAPDALRSALADAAREDGLGF